MTKKSDISTEDSHFSEVMSTIFKELILIPSFLQSKYISDFIDKCNHYDKTEQVTPDTKATLHFELEILRLTYQELVRELVAIKLLCLSGKKDLFTEEWMSAVAKSEKSIENKGVAYLQIREDTDGIPAVSEEQKALGDHWWDILSKTSHRNYFSRTKEGEDAFDILKIYLQEAIDKTNKLERHLRKTLIEGFGPNEDSHTSEDIELSIGEVFRQESMKLLDLLIDIDSLNNGNMDETYADLFCTSDECECPMKKEWLTYKPENYDNIIRLIANMYGTFTIMGKFVSGYVDATLLSLDRSDLTIINGDKYEIVR